MVVLNSHTLFQLPSKAEVLVSIAYLTFSPLLIEIETFTKQKPSTKTPECMHDF